MIEMKIQRRTVRTFLDHLRNEIKIMIMLLLETNERT